MRLVCVGSRKSEKPENIKPDAPDNQSAASGTGPDLHAG